MKTNENKLGDLLSGQEPVNSQTQTEYRRMVGAMMERKVHWFNRVLCGILALAGAVFCVSLLVELFESNRGDNDVAFVIKFSLILLLLCVLFYTMLIAGVAIRGRARLGGTPAAIFGAAVMAGFFICLWSFLMFVLPKLVELASNESSDPFAGNIWIISLVCRLLIIAFFGVLTAGISFLIHLLYSQFSSQRQKLLEIELALAELSEKAGALKGQEK
jgi:hypothetical protein